jgi:hypothetical protein
MTVLNVQNRKSYFHIRKPCIVLKIKHQIFYFFIKLNLRILIFLLNFFIQGVREWSPKNFRVSLSGKMWPKTFISFLDKLNRFLKIKLFPTVLGLLKYYFSASQSVKYSVTLHFRSREVRFPVQCQKFLVECGKNLVEYGKNVRTPLIYSFHSYFKIKVSIRYFNLV